MDSVPEFTACFTTNPLEADEFVWLTGDPDRAEVVLIQKPTRFKADKIVYPIERTEELDAQFTALSNEDFKALNLRATKKYTNRNIGVPRISMIATMKSSLPT
jgi:hypothetical protein